MGASLASWTGERETAAAHEASRLREAREHARRSRLLTAALRAAANDFSSYLDEEVRVAPNTRYPSDQRLSLSDTLDASSLGLVVAAGIDSRLLDVKVAPHTGEGLETFREALGRAGEAAEELGAALGEWADDVELRPPPE